MTELTMEIEEFRKMIKERPHAFDIFESGDLLLTEYHGVVIKAWKQNNGEYGKKLYRSSIPITKIGYAGIAHQDLDPFKKKNKAKKRVKETKRE